MPRTRSSEGCWGEGFADVDGFAATTVRCWDDLEADQLATFHPALLHDTPGPPVLDRLAAARRAWAWRLALLDPQFGPAPNAAADHASLFGRDSAATLRWLRWRGSRRHAAFVASAQAALALLDPCLARLAAGRPWPDTAEEATVIGFLSGVHPAFLTPAAAVAHERAATAAWLGVVARGRPALMPLPVADYLADVVRGPERQPRLHDPLLGRLAQGAARPDVLRAAARRRRAGETVIVRRSMERGQPVRASGTSALIPALAGDAGSAAPF